MKKLFLFVALLLVATSYVSAQSYWNYGWSEDSAVHVTAINDSYYIDFMLDIDSLVEVTHHETAGYYSTVELPKSYLYDFLDSVGRPMLPHRKIYLQVPEGYNQPISLSNVSIEYKEIDITYPYYPFQLIDSAGSNPFVVYDPSYLYIPDWTHDNRIDIIPDLFYFDEAGFCLDIYPYSYNPVTGKIRVIKHLQATIAVNLTQYQEPWLTIEGFLNWRQSIVLPPCPERIFIISPKAYDIQLARYAQYRQMQGHTVNIRYLEDIADDYNVSVTEITSSIIIDELISFYNAYKFSCAKPRFAILVGNRNVIPYSSGVYGNSNNPESDFEYSLPYISLDSAYIRMRMAVGRWPVSRGDTTSLKNIINNILKFEETTAIYTNLSDLGIDIVTGSGNAENRFFEGGNEQRQILKNYHTHLYDGRQYYNCDYYTTIEHNFNNDEIWMLIYNGHGNLLGFDQPLCINTSTISHLGTKFPPLVFGFACSTNKNIFGKNWLSSNPNDKFGISGFWGATTNAYLPYNNWLANQIFSHISHRHIGDALVAGCQKFNNKERFNHMKRYVFMGDPALHTFGYNPNSFYYIQQDNRDKDLRKPLVRIENQHLTIDLLSNNMQFYVYDIKGQLICEGNNTSNNSYDTTDWMPGIYLIVISDGEKTYTQRVKK